MSPPNLRHRDQWRPAVHPKTGEKLEDVIETLDGLFTINRTWGGTPAARRQLFMVWRRRPKPETADYIGAYPDGDAARDAAARTFERMV